MDLTCKKCGRWLGKTDNGANGLTVKCGNCKTNNVYNISTQSALYSDYLAIGGGYMYNNNRQSENKAKAAATQKAAENEPTPTSNND